MTITKQSLKSFATRLVRLVVVAIALAIGYEAGRLGKGIMGTSPKAGTAQKQGTAKTTAANAPGAQSQGAAKTTAAKRGKVKYWTCSMHPFIHSPKPGNCPICGMKLIPVMENAGSTTESLRELTLSPEAKKLAQIEVSPVERKFVIKNIYMEGMVAYDETRVADITAWVPGRLDRLFVDYTGVPVHKGDHMVYMYSPDILTAQQELLQALKTVKELGKSKISIVTTTAQETVAAAEEKLRLWGLTPDQIKEIEQRGTPSDHITIYAPASGIVVHKNALEGMYVKTGTKIYTIADLTHLWVVLDAYESDLEWLHYAQQVEFTTESYPGVTFRGRIAFISPVLDEATRTVKVRLNVDNADGRLKPGMFVRATVQSRIAGGGKVADPYLAGKWICPMHPEIIRDKPGNCPICGMPLVTAKSLGYVPANSQQAKPPLVIPASAPLITGRRAVVYVELPNKKQPTYEGREIVLGPRAGNYYVVRRGLSAGEYVVTRGNFKLDAEMQIEAKPSMMTPEGGGGSATAAGGGPTVLPSGVKAQLQDVITAAMVASNVAPDKLDKLHTAYLKLRNRVDDVNSALLTGRAALQWKEYAMLLGDDGEVGAFLKSSADAPDLAETTRNHLTEMKTKLGLASPSRPEPPARVEISPQSRKQLAAVVDCYMEIQAALAKDALPGAKSAAGKGLAALSALDMKLLSGQAREDWMKDQGQIKPLLSRLAAAKDLEAARKQFALLSEVVATVVARFKPMAAATYKFHCPMAFGGRGANWLQTDKNTRNPYLGGAMPKCGTVTGVISGAQDREGKNHE